jgi:hypothetical protein
MENLALACCFCNRYKGPNLSSIDPLSGKIAQLFNPRLDVWEGHFAWNGARFIGKTSTGRATIEALQMNRSDAIAVRELLMRKKVYWAG